MSVLYAALCVASWCVFGAIVVWLSGTTRRIHPDVARLIIVVAVMFLIAGVVFMHLATHP